MLPERMPQVTQAAASASAPVTGPHDGVAAAPAVAERPRLAPNVALCGQLADSGFAKPQWLVQRDGDFIQLTELLYRIAEQANGHRTLAEIAIGVSRAVGRRLTADHVRHLVAGGLVPRGIVLRAEDTDTARPGATTQAPTGSPLQVNAKLAVIGPRLIDPVARVLQVFFWPPVLIPALVLVVAAQGWLFFIHGAGGGVRDALASPGRLLATMTLIALGATFHEFGHAAALRYGGGRARSMGAGLYLIYPAFYTDTTDGYRLGRWARVRTDLGGFYFNLLFALGLVALYGVTGSEFLLLVVLIIDIDIARQSLPFVRYDGYWLLSDLIGMPDLLSYMGAFLRRAVPTRGRKAQKLPQLKTWVAAVYGLYVAATIPLLALMLVLMVKRTPDVLASAAEAARLPLVLLARAVARGDDLALAAAAAHLAILMVFPAGLVLVLVLVARGFLTALWRWSRPTPLRRGLGTAVTASAAALLLCLWAPQWSADAVASVATAVERQPGRPPSGAAALAEHGHPEDRLPSATETVPPPQAGGRLTVEERLVLTDASPQLLAYAEVLTVLTPKCRESRTELAEAIIDVRRTLVQERGVTIAVLDYLRGVDRVVPAGSRDVDCTAIAAELGRALGR